ncbi:MAG: fasciclin domain-containing protein [Acidobacteriota bacterium]|nr:fasciclin domain-containing protein [Acidobacteriota bacterium]
MINKRSNRTGILSVFTAVLMLASVATVSVNGNPSTKSVNKLAAQTGDIVDTAVAAGSFNTLAKALEAAGLVDALKGEGPFTVFAPTDEAFAKLPAGTIETLLRPENKDKLKAILLYHVVHGKVVAADVVKLNGKEPKTLQGGKVKISTKHGVMVDNAMVIKKDVLATNGVIHVIDTVLMPKMSANDRMSKTNKSAMRK